MIETMKGIESLLSSTIKARDRCIGGDRSERERHGWSDIQSKGNDFVTYARTEGAFIGLSIEGASIRTRDDLNMAYYGPAVRASDIMLFRSGKSNPHSQVLHDAVVKDADGKESDDGRGNVN